MVRKIISVIVIVFLAYGLSGQAPEWTEFDQRQKLYPAEEYFTGFAMNKKEKNESELAMFDKLKLSATDELVSTVQVTIESLNTQQVTEANNKLSKTYKSATTSFSKIDLTGLKTETYYDKKKKTGYVLVYVKKKDLIDYYLQRMKVLESNISGKIEAAKRYVSMNDEKNALKSYYQCMPLFREAESAYSIVMLLRASMEHIDKIMKYENEVSNGIAKISHSDQLNLTEVCNFMAYGLQMQTGDFFKEPIRLGTFTFEDTKMASPFSRRFISTFQKELIEENGYNIRTEAPQPGSTPPKYMLNGTYWKDGNNLKIVAILRNTQTGKPIASTQGSLPLKWLEARNISYKPENFGEAAENMKLFKKNEITNGGMQLDLWTNKGNSSPIFVEGDILKLYVRTNHECYLRIIDYMADGSKVLLVNNMYIGSDKVNKVVELPFTFRCAPPFGVEVLQANTQTKEFPPLRTRTEQGYNFIVDDVNGILSNTRGFVRVTNEDLKAEKRVVVTTMAK